MNSENIFCGCGPEVLDEFDLVCILMLGALWCIVIGSIIWYVIIPNLVNQSSDKKRSVHSWIEDHLTYLFFIVWAYGFIVYFAGSFVTPFTSGALSSLFSAVPMAIIHATEMFLGQSDISAIHQDRHNSFWFMMLYDTCHFLAVLGTLLFVFKHLGYYLKSRIGLREEESRKKEYESLYVFWNVNDESLTLAKSIADKRRGTKFRILFINTPSDENYGSQKLSFSRLFNFVSLRDNQLEQLEDIPEAMLISSYHKLSNLDVNEIAADIISGKLHLHELAKMIDRTADPASADSELGIHLFFLGEDRDANINSTLNSVRDIRIRAKQVNIYCQARRNAKTQWMNHYDLLHPNERTSIHVIDTASLSIMQLKQTPKHHPVNFVEFDHQTGFIKPTSKFRSAVIGFGETGLEALRFLYEFGTFVNPQRRRATDQESYFVTDDKMQSRRGLFYAKARELTKNDEIELQDYVIGSDQFWQAMTRKLPYLSYIVIAIGDDNLGIDTAIDFCTLARRLRSKGDKHRLSIYVRSYETANLKRLKAVQKDMNDSCKDYNINIEIFGSIEQVFTYDMIIDSRIIKEAKKYNYSYKYGMAAPTEQELEDCWKDQIGIKSDQNPTYTLTEFEEIERKRNQNICNSLHRHTKVHIMKICNEDLNVSQEIKRNIAILEHERWIACSKLSGWKEETNIEEKKDLTRKTHCDICDWDNIRKNYPGEQEETQEFDIKVVDTTIWLEKEENRERE